MTKKSALRAIVIPLAAIAAMYSAMTFVGCGGKSKSTAPPPPAVFKGNVFLDSLISTTLGGDANKLHYKFMHNSTNHAQTKMFVVFNEADSDNGNPTGTFHMYLLDLADLEKGTVTKLAEGTATGTTGAAPTITFRSSWTPDDSKVVLAAADRVFVIDATSNTLPSVNLVLPASFENHDALAIDGKYAILTLRTGTPLDGQIQLLDISTASPALVGNAVSVCNTCHGASGPSTGAATLCGLDGAVSKSGTTYSGTIYVAGHGGHLAKLAISVDDSGAAPVITTPVKYSTLTRLDVSTAKFGDSTSVRKLHDARLDGNTLYWSAINVDAAGKAHYGKIDLATSTVTDIPVDVDPRATWPGTASGANPYYCGSGQSATAFFPSTMTSEGYITVIPKADIK